MSRGDEHVPEDAAAADLEAAVDGRDAIDPGGHEALVPAAALAQLGDVAEELVHGRPVAVEDAQHERRRIAPPRGLADGEPGEGGGGAVTVALRAHQPLPDRRRPGPPGAGRVAVAAEDGDLIRPEARVAQRRVGDEAAEPGADDRDSLAHTPAYLTEPASRPWTK